MKLKKSILIIAALIIGTIACYADVTLPSQCKVSLPKVLLKPIIKEREALALASSGDWGQSNRSDKYWTAYSDREDNTTYNDPSESSVHGKLKFNEKVRIADIRNGFALVYEEGEMGSAYPTISRQAKPKGWVPMRNLLLWSSCPTNDAGIYNKALIVNNLDKTNGSNKGDLFKRYMNPKTRQKAYQLRSTMTFYFVMKKADGLVLLAKECKMEGYTSAVLYGWVSEANFAPWDQRTCLEPNWKPNIAREFEGKTVGVYKESSLSTNVAKVPLGKKKGIGNEATAYRMAPGALRYPLLENTSQNDNVYRMTAFATQGGVVSIPTSDEESEIEIVNDVLEEKSNINLIVVIDGTSSMEHYYEPARKMIQDAYDYFGKENGTKVRVGIVIYRDYTDGKYVTEHLKMTKPDDPNVESFLKKGGEYGVKSSPADRSYAEALYKGLEVALDAKTMGYTKEQSNLMFVIGDCGNDLDDKKCMSADALIKKSVENRVQISAFQVRNENEQAFLLFRKQMGDIVRGNLRAQYGKLGSTVKAGFAELADGYEFKTNLPESQNFYIGSVRNAKLGGEMDLKKLYELVMRNYMQFATAVGNQKDIAFRADEILALEGKSDVVGASEAAIDLAFVKTIYTPAQIEQLRKIDAIMAKEGFAAKREAGTGYDYWQPVIYISSDEFSQLMEKLAPVMSAANVGSSDRKPYVEAMKGLIRSMVPDITEKEMNEKDVKEVMAMIAGLNVVSGSLGGRTLIQIQDENIVKQDEFDGMISDFSTKYKKLQKIKGNKYDFSIERNKTTWYWIPVEDLP